jgi:hypothetical protein
MASRLPIDGVLLNAPDAWYVAGSRGAGFCEACETQLRSELVRDFGEQLIPATALPAIATQADKAPFWREREALRLRTGVEHGHRLAARIRDEGRRERNVDLRVGGRLLGLSAVATLLARRLDFAVIGAQAPTPDRAELGHYEIFRAALGYRPLVALASAELSSDRERVLQAARLATSVGAELSLPGQAPPAAHAALAEYRQFWREFRSRYRPLDRLAEVLLLYSAQCDHWSQGTHGAGVLGLAEALTRLGIQYRVILEMPRSGTEPIVLADASFLTEEDAGRIERRITEGAGAITVGPVGCCDENGRSIAGPFPELAAGLNRVGAGSVLALDLLAAGPRKVDTLLPGLEKALESLLGRGRHAASVSKPSVLVKMYVDPDRKLDVHLVGRQFDPATGAAEEMKGLTVHLSGSAVSGARTGYLFSQGMPERKVALSAFGMGVQATLPDFRGSAVLTVSR